MRSFQPKYVEELISQVVTYSKSIVGKEVNNTVDRIGLRFLRGLSYMLGNDTTEGKDEGTIVIGEIEESMEKEVDGPIQRQ